MTQFFMAWTLLLSPWILVLYLVSAAFLLLAQWFIRMRLSDSPHNLAEGRLHNELAADYFAIMHLPQGDLESIRGLLERKPIIDERLEANDGNRRRNAIRLESVRQRLAGLPPIEPTFRGAFSTRLFWANLASLGALSWLGQTAATATTFWILAVIVLLAIGALVVTQGNESLRQEVQKRLNDLRISADVASA